MPPTPPARFAVPYDSTLDDLLDAIRDREARQLAAWQMEEARWRDRVTLSEGQIRMLQQEVRKLRDRVDELIITKDSYAIEIIRLRDALTESEELVAVLSK